ncbi:MAG: hypothetical protein GC204_02695 [Chloroflexi bacterium]|nr:hypothetical protein [Chloroflexota bacterium]
MSPAQANKALVHRYIEMWNTGSTASANEILASNWRDHNHPEVTSPEGVKQAIFATRSAFPDFKITIEVMISEGDLVALRAFIQRTQQGSMTTSRVTWFVRVANGKMVELWTGVETGR